MQPPVNEDQKNGAPSRTRTCDFLLRRQRSAAQKPLKTLGETEVTTKGVTKSVTPKSESVTLEKLLQTFQSLPKDELVYLLTETIKNL